MRIAPTSENSCLITFGDTMSPDISERIAWTAERLTQHYGAALIDSVPSYTTLHLTTNLARLPIRQLCAELPALLQAPTRQQILARKARRIDVPVCYDSDKAPDLESVAAACGLSTADVVERHQSRIYRVYAIGFAPGFCFLGELDPKLARPRRATPRLRVPAGSVAIAEQQTAVYPSATPGGWHLIGRTPLDMRRLCCDEDEPVHIGDEIRFIAIDSATYTALGGSTE